MSKDKWGESFLESNMATITKIPKRALTSWPSNPTPGNHPKEIIQQKKQISM